MNMKMMSVELQCLMLPGLNVCMSAVEANIYNFFRSERVWSQQELVSHVWLDWLSLCSLALLCSSIHCDRLVSLENISTASTSPESNHSFQLPDYFPSVPPATPESKWNPDNLLTRFLPENVPTSINSWTRLVMLLLVGKLRLWRLD